MELTVQNLYGLLLRSHLLPLEEAKAMFARWQEEAKDGASNSSRFCSWLVANKYLTEYQATLLARGHAEGFFINEYKILDRLGKGRMAGVYKAQHQLGQVVAIKVLPPSRAKEPNMLARFHREARLALKLKHPNIVRAFQTGTAGDLHYLVMEYLEGETVEDVLVRRGKLPPAEAVRIAYQVALGLQHLHAQGAVHRDLKPSNLMLVGATPDSTARSTVKVLDIGLGRALFEEGTQEPPADIGLTGEGVLLGTPDYMAPEQANDPRSADIRSDIYSLGCVLYHLLSGQPPFPDKSIMSQLIRHATETARPLKEFNPAVPDGLQQIVNWMMAKDPAQRYPTPERAAAALQVFLSAGAGDFAAPDEGPSMKRYLTWLEVEGGRPGAVPPVPAAGPVAVAAVAGPAAPAASAPPGLTPTVVMPTPPPVKPAGGKPAAVKPPPVPTAPRPPDSRKERRSRHGAGKRRSKKEHHRKSPPPPPGGDETAPLVNVELVPLPGVGGKKVLGMYLGRRDFIAFGIGAAAGALATFLGCLIALTGKRAQPAPEPDKNQESSDTP
jgi:serine/threonine protein kinase